MNRRGSSWDPPRPGNRAASARDDLQNRPTRSRTRTCEVGARRAPVTPRVFRSGRPGSNGPLRGGSPALFRLSYVRDTPGWSRTSDLCRRRAALSSTELRASVQSLRQESNPHFDRTKGACSPLNTTEAEVQWRRRDSNPLLLGASEVLFPVELHPRNEVRTVESNHHSARRRGYNPLSSPVLSGRVKGVAGRARTGADGAHNPGCFRLHHGHHVRRGRPDSNRRPLA